MTNDVNKTTISVNFISGFSFLTFSIGLTFDRLLSSLINLVFMTVTENSIEIQVQNENGIRLKLASI